MVHLFHIAVAEDWARARDRGIYEVSTVGQSLEEVGFIHLSFAHQVAAVADAFYAGREDLVLLEFDAAALSAPVRLEKVGDSAQRFPHLYGPIIPGEVIAVHPFAPGADGSFPVIR